MRPSSGQGEPHKGPDSAPPLVRPARLQCKNRALAASSTALPCAMSWRPGARGQGGPAALMVVPVCYKRARCCRLPPGLQPPSREACCAPRRPSPFIQHNYFGGGFGALHPATSLGDAGGWIAHSCNAISPSRLASATCLPCCSFSHHPGPSAGTLLSQPPSLPLPFVLTPLLLLPPRSVGRRPRVPAVHQVCHRAVSWQPLLHQPHWAAPTPRVGGRPRRAVRAAPPPRVGGRPGGHLLAPARPRRALRAPRGAPQGGVQSGGVERAGLSCGSGRGGEAPVKHHPPPQPSPARLP